MNKDATRQFEEYKSWCIALWNEFLINSMQNDRVSRMCWHFDLLSKRLFHATILEPCGHYLDIESEMKDLPKLFRVCCEELNKSTLFVSRNVESSGYWDGEISSEEFDGIELAFVNFFDFDDTDKRSFEYILVEILQFPGNPELVGRNALTPSNDARYISLF